ncbi:hypothetical protein BJG93_35395 [Paraburkholderia sprentiae WSM5005]|uniref:Bacterial CdiA-CT RNAse A domain-containing protein n=1 Tax=Paraburkholderia sprentiae WSM5005 TaxID=754502 RepID=A0A8F4QI53_9BURK|nr:RNase A-like domain-containing protein [Paraburkholderia sprentiae]QXE07202.1 hypothetical protein BJG93_35395 [Paraburkholderia sprentiae WSM5005]
MALEKNVERKVGCASVKENHTSIDSSTVEVVVKYRTYNGMPYYILTAMLDK